MTGKGGSRQNRIPNRGKDDILTSESTTAEIINAVNLLAKRMTTQETVSTGILNTLKGIDTALHGINDTNTTSNAIMENINIKLKSQDDVMAGVTTTLTETENAMKRLSETALAQTKVLTAHDLRFVKLDQEDKRKVVIMEGCPEDPHENLPQIIGRLFKDIQLNIGPEQIDTIERVGPFRQERNQDGGANRGPRPRSVRIVFYKSTVKSSLMKGLKHLKGNQYWSGVSIGDELNDLERRQFMDIRAMYFLAKSMNMDTRLRQRAIIIDKKSYPHHMLDRMPYPELTLEKATTATTPDGLLFRSNHNRYSNLYPCKIKDEGVEFTSVEQAFQAKKASVCKDNVAREVIMSLDCPYKIMQAGKKVKETVEWAKMAESQLYKFNKLKFSDPDLKAHLLNSGEKHMYEASFHLYGEQVSTWDRRGNALRTTLSWKTYMG